MTVTFVQTAGGWLAESELPVLGRGETQAKAVEDMFLNMAARVKFMASRGAPICDVIEILACGCPVHRKTNTG